MGKIIFCLFCFFQLAFSFVQGQQSFQLKGIVKNAKDSTPIAYAHVGVLNRGFGVVTNEVGAFSLNYPPTFLKDTLQVSYLGYATYSMVLSRLAKLPSSDSLIIYLKYQVLPIDEITITPPSDSGKIILKAAFSKLKKNFPNKAYQMNAFYREKVQNRDDYRYTRLMEGMLDIRDWGIQSNPDKIRIRLNEFRKSSDLSKRTLSQWTWKKLFGEQNNLYDILLQDPVRIHYHNERADYGKIGEIEHIKNSRRYWLGEVLLARQSSVRIAGITSYDGQKVFHLKFKYPDTYGDIYVNSSDFGIHHIDIYNSMNNSIDFESIPIGARDAFKDIRDNMQFEGKYGGKLSIDYQKIGEKYYLSYINWLLMGDVRKSNVNEGKKTVAYSTCFLMVNSIQTNKKEMEKVRISQTISKDENVNNIKIKYNETFWKYYNVLLATPVENEVIKDLTFEESLEQQFKKNQ